MAQLNPSPARLRVQIFFSVLIVACLTIFEACGSGVTPMLTPVTISPSPASVPFGWTQQFDAAISGNSTTNVTWAVNEVVGGTSSSGTIDASGLYTAPAVPPVPASVSITAVSKADSNLTGSASVHLTGLFAYATNQGDGTLSNYSINAAGLLVPLASAKTTTGPQPYFLASTTDGKYLYVTDGIADAVYAYSIDPVTGALTQVGLAAMVGSGPRALAIHPTNRYLYVACLNTAGVYGFSIDASTGSLTALPGSPFPNAGLRESAIALDPAGNFAFVPNNASHDVSVFAVNSANGELTSVGSPIASGSAPIWAVTDASGKQVYVLSDLDNIISAYSVAGTGALSPMSPPTIAGVSDPLSATVSPSGNFLYVPNWIAASVSAFSIDPATGNLGAVTGSPFGTGSLPVSLAFEPSGKYAYVTNQAPNAIWGFSVNKTTGFMSQLPWTVTAGKVTTSITVVTTHP